jgi:DNA-binding MarR family transcriptional regulator
MRHIRKMAFEEANECVSIPQMRILGSIDEGFDQVSSLARMMGVSQAAISKMVDVLTDRELVTRKVGDDRRVIRLTLTEKGEEMNRRVHTLIEGKLDIVLKNLTKQDKEELKAGLKVLSKVFGRESLL